MNPGLIGGILGGVIGTMGGVFGTYCSIKNTNGPKERAFVVKASIICWIFIILFLLLMFLLPNPYRWFLWVPYGIGLPIGIIQWNKKQMMIRKE